MGDMADQNIQDGMDEISEPSDGYERPEDEIARLKAEVAGLKLKLDQARGDIRHIREYEVKPRDEAFRELRLNDDIADCIELVLRERGLLED